MVYTDKDRKRWRKYYYEHREYEKLRSKKYYYKNRKKILKYQIKRWSDKYKNDDKFRKKRQFRDSSRKHKCKIIGVCSICRNVKDLQRHHPDYRSKKIMILCRRCHNKVHHHT